MYALVTDSLPPHSTQPYPAFALALMDMKKRQIEYWAARAKAGVACAPNPVDYVDLGPQIMADVARAPQQGLLTGSNALSPATPSPTPTDISQPPQVVPMNVPTSAAVPLITSTPRGAPPAGQNVITPGTAWGNSPVTPPAPAAPNLGTLISSIPSWVWVVGGVFALMTMKGTGSKQGLKF